MSRARASNDHLDYENEYITKIYLKFVALNMALTAGSSG